MDLGVNNLITLVDSILGEEGRVPQIINGRPLKSINQFYNKKRASILFVRFDNQFRKFCRNGQDIQEELASAFKSSSKELFLLLLTRTFGIGVKSNKTLRKITDWRNEKVDDYMHKASRDEYNAQNIGALRTPTHKTYFYEIFYIFFNEICT